MLSATEPFALQLGSSSIAMRRAFVVGNVVGVD